MISNAQLSHDNVLDKEIRNTNPFVNVRPHDGYDQRLPPSLRKLLNPVSPLSVTTSKPLLSSISPRHPPPLDPKSYLDHFQVINAVHDSELDKESDLTPDSSDKGENDFDIRFTSSSNLTSPPWSNPARSSKASSSGTSIFAARDAPKMTCRARHQLKNNEIDVLLAEVLSLRLLISRDTKRDASDIFLNRRRRWHALVFFYVTYQPRQDTSVEKCDQLIGGI
ncbi:uncharacterized protein MELLADRAFT_114980 [Melampsora larici-populina 98AG31]|uniref:Uncharacterized protein n=1 Tax=Melampsora larici-populina (strain 98AG31 / pathotype 3-4-7) TaxID=747676 RepID=F4R4Y3_MELLP|nr:uncharacterized protein MELLADRAFT_114980 [Melampsora larici-populina 98AG31]EGG12883.1 hypothetical protein MELLADRAFT_114980 [Melampsora larici-populina 98AG31]